MDQLWKDINFPLGLPLAHVCMLGKEKVTRTWEKVKPYHGEKTLSALKE